MKKIVTIGGGTGHYTLLRGLKNYDVDLTAIVSIVDNGGSSGNLRVEFGILPPGDLRNCLLALADDIKLKDLMDLFEYRFPGNSNLANHNLGNLILTALTDKHKDIGKAIKSASNILNISGKVIPVSLDITNIYAETLSGEKLNGQLEVSYPHKEERIKRIWLNPEAYIYKESAEAIRNADLIVISPGDLYGSILPNFLVSGFQNAIRESRAKIIYVCNLVTKQGSHDFKVSDFKEEIEKYLSKKIDYIICNTKKPTKQIVDKYKEQESFFIEPDLSGENIIKQDLLEELEINNLITARHNPEKTAKLIMSLV
jgi:uncharacterized cofD-like protein